MDCAEVEIGLVKAQNIAVTERMIRLFLMERLLMLHNFCMSTRKT